MSNQANTPKPVAQIIPMAAHQAATGYEPQRSMTGSDAKFIGKLFTQLKDIFPAWRTAFPTIESEAGARREWSIGLIEAGCTSREQISRGMRKARQHSQPWLPSIGMFIEWCQADSTELGLPSMEQAYNQAVGNERVKHPAVVFTLRNLADSYGFKQMATKDSKAAWAKAWQQTILHVERGGELPKPELQIEQKISPADREFARALFDEFLDEPDL